MWKMGVFFIGLITTFLIDINTANAEVTFGNPKGSIVLVEYFDYNCPVCRSYMPTIDAVARANPDVNVIQRVVPVLARSSQVVDRAVLSAYFQGKFPQMQQAILHISNHETIPPQEVLMIAKALNLDLRQLYQDMNSYRVKQQLVANVKAFEVTHQNRVPVIVLYNVSQPHRRLTFVGTQRLTTLQQAIRALQQNHMSFNHKENSHDAS